MGTPFSPTRKDVERYRRLRALSMDLNHRIIETIPRRAYDDVGNAIGILRNGVLEFDSKDMTSVLMDCCLHDWFENGKNVVQLYSERHPAKPGTDEFYLLKAYLQAKYRLLVVQSAVPGAGLHCQDVLNSGGLFLMDLGLSQSVKGANAALATRTIPLGEFWMTSGAGLPINSKKAALDALSQIAGGNQKSLEGPGSGGSIDRARVSGRRIRRLRHLRERRDEIDRTSPPPPVTLVLIGIAGPALLTHRPAGGDWSALRSVDYAEVSTNSDNPANVTGGFLGGQVQVWEARKVQNSSLETPHNELPPTQARQETRQPHVTGAGDGPAFG